MTSGIGKGCALSLLAVVISLCITYPVVAFFAHMKSPFFGWAGMHGGTWIVVWWILFFPMYVILVKIDNLRQRQKKRIPKLDQNQT
jgi:uncharacterized membrane protein